ncbi:MAG: hypothetical protein QOG53_119 [Frankiales bacterium]|jgi:hypothetical protein|nr:hypothetical protein [Frankiales bacterium]
MAQRTRGSKAIRLTLGITGAALMVAVSAPANAGQGLQGTFSVHFPKGHPASNAPCPEDEFCGVGSLVQYGKATISIVDDTFDEIPGSSCLATTRSEEIRLLDGTGTLALNSSGTFCRPGGSGDSNASDHSYGSPGTFSLTYVVDEAASTGRFANASGSGDETMKVAGGVGTWKFAGTLSVSRA